LVMAKASETRASIASALREHRKKLRSFVAVRAPAADVEDILQMGALRAIEKAPTLKDPNRVLPWRLTVHRNVAADAARERGRRERALDRSVHAADEIALWPAQHEEAICGCGLSQARRMSPAYASVLDLVDAGGASLREAAETLGISVNNTTVRLHRARKALKKAMLEHCGVESLRECQDCRCAHEGCCSA